MSDNILLAIIVFQLFWIANLLHDIRQNTKRS
jgi:hypothetical protein